MAGMFDDVQPEPRTDTAPSGGGMFETVPAGPSLTAGQVAKRAVQNIPSSAFEFGKNIVYPFRHPEEAYEGLSGIAKGVMQKLGVVSGNESEKYADAVGQFLKDRYGSIDNIKYTLSTDPVGVASDISTLLTGGGMLAARGPGVVGQLGRVAATAGRLTDPLSAVGGVAKGGAAIGRHVAGEYLGGVGERPIAEAFKAGKEGGEKARQFRASMRHPEEEFPETVRQAREAVAQVGRDVGAAYRSGMADISQDRTILNFGKIDDAIDKANKVGKFKAADIGTEGEKAIRQEMIDKIEAWKSLPGADYHTPEGFDALKKSLGKIRQEKTKPGTPAYTMATILYDGVRDSILDQAKTYGKIMEGYSEGQRIVEELEKELTGKQGAPLGPSMRKLQKVLKNDVSSAYGYDASLAQFLVDNGATNLMTRLAGHALSSPQARGIGGRIVGNLDYLAALGAAVMGHPEGLLALPFISPRVLGEAAQMAGWSSSYLPGRRAGEALFQLGRATKQVAGPVASGTQAVRENLPSIEERTARAEAVPFLRFDQNGNQTEAQ